MQLFQNLSFIFNARLNQVKKEMALQNLNMEMSHTYKHLLQAVFYNPIPTLGYLKTRICWGGGQFDPPPHLNPLFDVQI